MTSSNYFEKSLFLILREKKLGYGTAYIEAFNWGLNKDYDYFVQMDADFSHRMEDLKKMLKSKEIGEDDEKSKEKIIQTITDDHIKSVDEKVSLKEKEIMTI